jgi:hypothetical protein
LKIFVIGGYVAHNAGVVEPQADVLERVCNQIGGSLVDGQHTIILCSPFDDAADVHVLRGAVATPGGRNIRIEFHFVDSPDVHRRLNEVVSELKLSNVSKIPHPPPQTSDAKALSYAWLFCQLSALESSHATIAVGGNPDGASNMLLLLAEGKRKPVLPLPFMGGAAKQAFDRCRYELEDRLGAQFSELHDESIAKSAGKFAVLLANAKTTSNMYGSPPSFFISYARERQAEADHVEILLRRRKLRVFRDESDFGAGHIIPNAIREAIFGANIFIALWSAEYACSPWCFDELELALDRHAEGTLSLWLLRIDKTRLVPLRARDLIYYDCDTRDKLEGRMIELLGRTIENVNT